MTAATIAVPLDACIPADLWAAPVASLDDDAKVMHLSAPTCNRGGVASTAGRETTADRLGGGRASSASFTPKHPHRRGALVARHAREGVRPAATASSIAQVACCPPPLTNDGADSFYTSN